MFGIISTSKDKIHNFDMALEKLCETNKKLVDTVKANGILLETVRPKTRKAKS